MEAVKLPDLADVHVCVAYDNRCFDIWATNTRSIDVFRYPLRLALFFESPHLIRRTYLR